MSVNSIERKLKNISDRGRRYTETRPSTTSLTEGEEVISNVNGIITMYRKQNGKLYKINYSSNGKIILDEQLVDLKHNVKIGNDLNISGNVGIGKAVPEGNLHISSLTDATFILEADTDNTPEGDNPKIEMRQDGNAVHGFLGIEGDAGELYTNSLANTVYLESKNNDTATSNIQFVTGGDYDATSPVVKGSARMTILATGQVGIGTNAPSTNADLTLESGVLNLKETTTPTDDTNYGKIYTKSDNKLYFQDGAGNEYTVDITSV